MQRIREQEFESATSANESDDCEFQSDKRGSGNKRHDYRDEFYWRDEREVQRNDGNLFGVGRKSYRNKRAEWRDDRNGFRHDDKRYGNFNWCVHCQRSAFHHELFANQWNCRYFRDDYRNWLLSRERLEV